MALRLLIAGVLLSFTGDLFGQQTSHQTQKPKTGSGSAQQAPLADKLLREALQAYSERQLDRALMKLKEAYRLAPGNSRVRLTLGLVLYETDPANAEAQVMMESVASEFATNQELQLKLLDSYLQLHDELKLASRLQNLQGLMTGNSRFAFDVIYTAIRYGQLEIAQKQLEIVSARLQLGREKLTEADLKQPSHQALMHELGEVNFIKGMIAASRDDKAEAISLFQTADRYDFPPRNSLQMQMLAEALFRMQEYSLSIQAYEEYLKHSPLDVGARMQLALGYYTTASFLRARENFQKVLEQAPQTETLHLYLGLTLLELKRNEDARREFHEALKVDPKSYQALAELAYLSYLDGDNDACRAWLDQAQPLNPDWVETNMVFGLLYNRLGQFDRASQFLEVAVKANPKYSRAHYQLSMAYRRSGNEAKAKEHSDVYERLTAAEKARQLGERVP